MEFVVELGSFEGELFAFFEGLGSGIGAGLFDAGEERQLQILVPDFGFAAGVELQGNNAAASALGVVEIDTGLAVDPGLRPAADADDFVAVPVVVFDVGFVALVPQERAAVFFVEFPPPASADVGLVAFDFAIGHGRAADLDAAVPFVLHELDVKLQAEIADRQLIDQPRVVGQPLGLTYNLSVLDRPELLVPPPASEVFSAVERGDVVGRGEHRGLAAGTDIGDQRAELVLAELLNLIVRHQRLVAEFHLLDVVLGQLDHIVGSLERVHAAALPLENAGDHLTVRRADDVRGIFLGHDGTRVDDVGEQIVEIGPLRPGDVRPDLGPRAEQRVALLASLGEHRPPELQVRLHGGRRHQQALEPGDLLSPLGRGFAHDPPHFCNPLVEPFVAEIAKLGDQVSREIAGGDLLLVNRREQLFGISHAAAESGQGITALGGGKFFVKGEDGGRGFGVVESRQAADGVTAEVFAGQNEAKRVHNRSVLRADEDFDRLAALRECRVLVGDHPAEGFDHLLVAESCPDRGKLHSKLDVLGFDERNEQFVPARGDFHSLTPLERLVHPTEKREPRGVVLGVLESFHQERKRLLGISRSNPADHVFLENRNLLPSRESQSQRPLRIDIRKGLHGVPVHEGQIRVGGVFGVFA